MVCQSGCLQLHHCNESNIFVAIWAMNRQSFSFCSERQNHICHLECIMCFIRNHKLLLVNVANRHCTKSWWLTIPTFCFVLVVSRKCCCVSCQPRCTFFWNRGVLFGNFIQNVTTSSNWILHLQQILHSSSIFCHYSLSSALVWCTRKQLHLLSLSPADFEFRLWLV